VASGSPLLDLSKGITFETPDVDMATRLNKMLLVVANLLIPISIAVFAMGFFPYKPFMPGLATYEELGFGLDGVGIEDEVGNTMAKGAVQPVFDKVVFMVVDALRSDFVYAEGSGFNFVRR
jgi:ethanolaminephosphotransferase